MNSDSDEINITFMENDDVRKKKHMLSWSRIGAGAEAGHQNLNGGAGAGHPTPEAELGRSCPALVPTQKRWDTWRGSLVRHLREEIFFI